MFENLSMFELFVKGGYTMVALGFCSVLSIAVIIERLLYFRYVVKFSNKNTMKLISHLKECLSKNSIVQGIAKCDEDNSLLAKVLKSVLSKSGFSKEEIKESISRTLEIEILEMEKYTGILATIGVVSPFVGLFGTVLGIMRAFHDLSVSTSAGPSVVSAGISEALITTAAGLFVAVPAVIAYNYFARRIKKTVKSVNLISSDFAGEITSQHGI